MVEFLDLEFLVKKYDRINYKPKPITKENFKKFGDMITTADISQLKLIMVMQKDMMELQT